MARQARFLHDPTNVRIGSGIRYMRPIEDRPSCRWLVMPRFPSLALADSIRDEAHHATGDYSYNKVVRFLMAKNPHFRLLALTATPGNNVEAIQRLIDGLHISRIEIRNENSLDLKPYLFEKVRR